MAKRCRASQSESRQRQVFPTTTNNTTTNMTEAEARQLKPGDRVLVEMKIQDVLGHSIYLFSKCADFSDIREKVAPPRRKFKKGDIVRTHRGYVFFAVEDEDEDGNVSVEQSEELDAGHFAKAENLTLLLAMENRKDREEGDV